jgi:transposase-like protein
MESLRKTELSGRKDVPRSARLGEHLAERPLGLQRARRNGLSPIPGLLTPQSLSIPLTERSTSPLPESERDSVRAGKRWHSAEIKFRAVLDVMTGRQTLAEVAHVYQVQPLALQRWKDRFLECGAELFEREFPDQAEAKVNGERIRTHALDGRSPRPDNQRNAAEFLPGLTTLSALLRQQAD